MAETIFALATPPGRSGVAVLRISGPNAFRAAEALGAAAAPPRRAVLRRLFDPVDGRVLDDALAIRFARPRSFTGEDVVELHLHGGPAVCRSVIAALTTMAGLRLAEAGEFTRRALLNGKLDLAQAEGLGDLLAAETTSQVGQAMALMSGGLSEAAGAWRDDLVQALASIEATIDFVDEDVPVAALAEACALLARVAGKLEAELAGSRAAERMRDGFEVALVGAPNVGKSTLLNVLAGREAALTSEVAGTTRDVIEVRMELDGLPVTFVDMAGLRDSVDPLESLGVRHARRRAAAADLRLFLLGEPTELAALGVARRPGDLAVLGKADLRGAGRLLVVDAAVSGRTGDGVADLLDRVASELRGRVAGSGLTNRARHREAVERAQAATRAAAAALGSCSPEVEVAAVEILAALHALDRLVGRTDVEAVLDAVFARFCIGK